MSRRKLLCCDWEGRVRGQIEITAQNTLLKGDMGVISVRSFCLGMSTSQVKNKALLLKFKFFHTCRLILDHTVKPFFVP